MVGWADQVGRLAQFDFAVRLASRRTANILCRAPGVHGALQSFFIYLYFNLIIRVNV
jgi:uncharacterized metal-binding protein